MHNSSGEPEDELKVTFWPPLHEQRRAWVLDILRRENVTSIVDIGCGEGALLACLCNPASALPDHTLIVAPHNQPQTPTFTSASDRTINALEDDDALELHIAHVSGLDVDPTALQDCIAATRPRYAADGYADRFALRRWEPLRVHIWEGSLAVKNDAFVSAECIVAMEVIEHLPPDVLDYFAPMLLCTYRPRLLLVTTPSYTFNARFSPPSHSSPPPSVSSKPMAPIRPGGYPDPTHRTNRIFRHLDHKFEWTVSEFHAWCAAAAARCGYVVTVGGVGVPVERDPWGRDEALGKASQVAVFRRNDAASLEADMGLEKEVGLGERHRLLATHEYVAHPEARRPRSLEEIASAVTAAMEEYYFVDGWTLWDLWVEGDISALCGGSLDLLIQAIEHCNALCINKAERRRRDWRVFFGATKHSEIVEKLKTAQETDTWADNAPSDNGSGTPENIPSTTHPPWGVGWASWKPEDSADASWNRRVSWDSTVISRADDGWGSASGWEDSNDGKSSWHKGDG